MTPRERTRMLVLVAEDNLTSRVMLEETLKGWDYSVISMPTVCPIEVPEFESTTSKTSS